MRYYLEADTDQISRQEFEDTLRQTIKAGRLFIVKGIAKDAFLLTTGEESMTEVTDEQAGRLYVNIISQIDNAIDHA